MRLDATTEINENPDDFRTDDLENEEDSSDSNSVGNSAD
uniref:Uncharacterized protein n=1 Tax=Wuchereria bancrofti TaxID=6293 RepID=A0A1I8EM53_WUCBA